MTIPKTLAQNSGFDPQDSVIKLQVRWAGSAAGVCVCVCVCVCVVCNDCEWHCRGGVSHDVSVWC